jgi:hypothetical protein
MNMTLEEEIEYNALGDKRDCGKLTNKEYKRYLTLLDKAFSQGLLEIIKTYLSPLK